VKDCFFLELESLKQEKTQANMDDTAHLHKGYEERRYYDQNSFSSYTAYRKREAKEKQKQ
jgi:hypothetical protein